MIYRIFVEKKDNVQARKEAADIKTLLNITTEDFRLVLRYDVEGLTEDELKAEKKNTKETLIADIKKYGRTLNKDFASECNDVMTKYGFGKGQTRLDDASDGQIQHLDNILEALKDIAYRNKIDIE